jgi:hypothetical protein
MYGVLCLAVAIVAGALLTGCGGGRASGPAFRPEELSGDRAVIYVFRDARGLRTRNMTLFVDQQEVGRLPDGGYRAVVVGPGEHFVRVVSSVADSARGVAVGPGESAYVRVTNARYKKGRPQLEVTTADEGRRLISGYARAE